MRTFRIDRIRAVEPLATEFAPPPDFAPLAYLFASFEAIPDRWDVEVLLTLPLDEAKRRVPRGMATLTAAGDRVRMVMSMRDLDETARWLAGLGCEMAIIRPPELRSALLDLAAALRRMALDEPASVEVQPEVFRL
jgi:predicted DNA-binding transcriptional regulator YafY